MSGKLIKQSFLALILGLFPMACGANNNILKSGKESNAQSNVQTKSSIEEDLDGMRTAGFNYVYVLRRKDGGVIDAEDKGVIKINTAGANRRVASDGDKAFIIGTNPALPPNNMMALYERFSVENYSPEPLANANSNSNK